MSWPQVIFILKLFKNFFAFKVVLVAIHQFPEKFQKHFRLQICLRSKSSLSWKFSKTFSPANLSYPQIIIILKIIKVFSTCKNALAANHHYPEITQRIYRLLNCLRSKSSLSWNYLKNFSPANWSYLQIIIILKIIKVFFTCKNALAANHLYPEITQRIYRLLNCLRRKSSLSWNYSKTLSPAKLS